jgi:hypothetical protein
MQRSVRIVICQGEAKRVDGNTVLGDLVLDGARAAAARRDLDRGDVRARRVGHPQRHGARQPQRQEPAGHAHGARRDGGRRGRGRARPLAAAALRPAGRGARGARERCTSARAGARGACGVRAGARGARGVRAGARGARGVRAGARGARGVLGPGRSGATPGERRTHVAAWPRTRAPVRAPLADELPASAPAAPGPAWGTPRHPSLSEVPQRAPPRLLDGDARSPRARAALRGPYGGECRRDAGAIALRRKNVPAAPDRHGIRIASAGARSGTASGSRVPGLDAARRCPPAHAG